MCSRYISTCIGLHIDNRLVALQATSTNMAIIKPTKQAEGRALYAVSHLLPSFPG